MQSQSTVLVIGVATAPQPSSVLDVYTAATAREALATIRLVSFDLMVVGLENPSLDVWGLMQRVIDAWPQLRWILASGELSPEEEILARSLGALMVLSTMPQADWIAECAASLRRREVATRVQPLPMYAGGIPAMPGQLASAKAS
jgi:DNA-binding response OmpR family regulator